MPYKSKEQQREYDSKRCEELRKAGVCERCRKNPSPAGEVCQGCRDYWVRRNAATRREALTKVSGGVLRCACCGCEDERVLSIEHLLNNGAQHRRDVGRNMYHWINKQAALPDGLAVWCMNCQAIKKILGDCVHHNPNIEEEWFNKDRNYQRSQFLVLRENIEIVLDVYSGGTWACTRCGWNDSPYGLELVHLHNDAAAVMNAQGKNRRDGGQPLCQKLVAEFHTTGIWPSGYTITCANCNHIEEKERRESDALQRSIEKAAGRESKVKKMMTPVVDLLNRRKPGQQSPYGRRLDANGFARYPNKDELMRQFLAASK